MTHLNTRVIWITLLRDHFHPLSPVITPPGTFTFIVYLSTFTLLRIYTSTSPEIIMDVKYYIPTVLSSQLRIYAFTVFPKNLLILAYV